jgi:large subunit ribosomal protein L5e
MYVRFFLLSI